MYIIGVFGKMGSGKSSFMMSLDRHNAEIFYTDEINAELLKDDKYRKLLERKFPDCCDLVGRLSKDSLKKEIFQSKEANQKLTKIAHPRIKRILKKRMKESGMPIIYVEMSVFTEKFLKFDEKWLITAPIEDQIRRVMKRDRVNEDVARRYIEFQELPGEDYFDKVFVNDEPFSFRSKGNEESKRVLKQLNLND